ncbi:MAG: hypothetical protein K2M30_00305 [Desulfovibrionaceae bacterium]|nr:hypothetical protein [Desulfovibrionaceae bacterium]
MKRDDSYQSEIIELFEVLEALFDEESGCPFDREQTLRSMCKYILDEVYEFIDAVYTKKNEGVIEELGDILFLLVMTMKVYSREHKTLFTEALHSVVEKMKRRPPYVFGSEPTPTTKEEYIAIWEKIKKEEKRQQQRRCFSDSIPQPAHPFNKAIHIQRKSSYIPSVSESDRPAKEIYTLIAKANAEHIDILDDLEEYNQSLLQKLDADNS